MVVLQVRADPGQVGDDGDAVVAQVIGRADAGKHQQLGAVVGAGRDQHLARRPDGAGLAALAVADADGAAVLDEDAVDPGAGDDGQALVAGERVEERLLGVGAVACGRPQRP